MTVREVFEQMMNDPEQMSKIYGAPFREAAFFAMFKYVREGGDLLDLPWFAAIKSMAESRADMKYAA